MKKTILALLVCALLLGLSACQSPSAPPVEVPEENSSETGTNPPKTSSKEEAPAEPAPLPAKVRVVVQTTSRDEIDEQGRRLLYATVANPVAHIARQPEAQEAINRSLRGQFDACQADAEAYLQWAKEDLQAENRAQDTAWLGYGLQSSVVVGRADARVISLRYENVSFTGGSHPNSYSLGLSYDAETGEILQLASLGSDPVQFDEAVKQELRTQLQSPAYADLTYDTAADSVEDVLDQQTWYLSAEGLEILCNPYVIAPHATGTLRFTIPYAQLEAVMQQQWLPEPRLQDAGELILAAADANYAETDTLAVDEAGTTVLLAADGVLTNVRVSRVQAGEAGNYQEIEQLYACNRMGPDDALSLTALLPEGMPNLSVSYTDTAGRTRAYAVCESGKDGTRFLLDLTDIWQPAL